MHSLRRPTVILSVSVALTVFVASCGPNTVNQCNKLAQTINKGQPIFEKYEKETKKLGSTFEKANKPEDLKAAAKKFAATINKGASEVEGFSKEIQAVELKDEKLKGYRKRAAKVFADYSGTFRELSKAMEALGNFDFTKEEPGKIKKIEADMNAAEKKIARIDKEADKLASEKNSYCGVK